LARSAPEICRVADGPIFANNGLSKNHPIAAVL